MKLIFAFEAISGRAALSLILETHRCIGETIAFFLVKSHDNNSKAKTMERACETRSAIFRNFLVAIFRNFLAAQLAAGRL